MGLTVLYVSCFLVSRTPDAFQTMAAFLRSRTGSQCTIAGSGAGTSSLRTKWSLVALAFFTYHRRLREWA